MQVWDNASFEHVLEQIRAGELLVVNHSGRFRFDAPIDWRVEAVDRAGCMHSFTFDQQALTRVNVAALLQADQFGRTEIDEFYKRHPGTYEPDGRPVEKKHFCEQCREVVTLPGNYIPRCPECKRFFSDDSYAKMERATKPRGKPVS